MWLPGIKWDASSPCGSSLLLILPATNGTSLCARGRFRCLLVDVAELRVVGRAGGHAAQRLVGFKHCKNGTKEAGDNHRRVLAWSTFDDCFIGIFLWNLWKTEHVKVNCNMAPLRAFHLTFGRGSFLSISLFFFLPGRLQAQVDSVQRALVTGRLFLARW